MTQTSIEWTTRTWNPVAGCTSVSPGCMHCYAMRMAARLEACGQRKYADTTRMSGGRPKWSGKVVLDYPSLGKPMRWRKGCKIFVNSMSDLLHEDVPLAYIRDVYAVMAATPQHTYQILTKRADRLPEISPALVWHDNVWMGVSVEHQDYLWRVDQLRRTPAKVKFLSLEPLLGPLVPGLNLAGIDWVIVGGESGPGARPMHPDWARAIRDLCVAEEVLFFFKQWGGRNKRLTGRELDGQTWNQSPVPLHRHAPAPKSDAAMMLTDIAALHIGMTALQIEATAASASAIARNARMAEVEAQMRELERMINGF